MNAKPGGCLRSSQQSWRASGGDDLSTDIWGRKIHGLFALARCRFSYSALLTPATQLSPKGQRALGGTLTVDHNPFTMQNSVKSASFVH